MGTSSDMEIHGFSRIPPDFQGLPRISKDFHGFGRISPRISTDLEGFPRISENFENFLIAETYIVKGCIILFGHEFRRAGGLVGEGEDLSFLFLEPGELTHLDVFYLLI